MLLTVLLPQVPREMPLAHDRRRLDRRVRPPLHGAAGVRDLHHLRKDQGANEAILQLVESVQGAGVNEFITLLKIEKHVIISLSSSRKPSVVTCV